MEWFPFPIRFSHHLCFNFYAEDVKCCMLLRDGLLPYVNIQLRYSQLCKFKIFHLAWAVTNNATPVTTVTLLPHVLVLSPG